MFNTEQKIKKLIVDECACYSPNLNGIKHYCDREYDEDCCCRLFKDERCGYFERAVLPMNPQLEALYKAKESGYELPREVRDNTSSVKGKVNTHCKKCGKNFLADNYRQQYCKICKKYIQRENQRNWISKKRNANVENQLLKTVDI